MSQSFYYTCIDKNRKEFNLTKEKSLMFYLTVLIQERIEDVKTRLTCVILGY